MIDIENLLTGGNPRQYFDEKALAELAESIKQVGIIQPITVRKMPNTENMYSIIAGERRYRASKLAGLTQMPAYLRECTEEEALDIALTENLQREDMTDLETAEAVKTMIEVKKFDIKTIAVKLGKSEKYVRDRYQLNNLIDDFKKMLSENSINIGKAVFLASYPQDLQEQIFKDHFTNENWNYWAELSLSKFENHLDGRFNSNLENAIFDTTSCTGCQFNSSFGRLFSDETARCLNKPCFIDKQDESKFKKIADVIEENPTLPIIRRYHVSDWVLRKFEENSFELAEDGGTYYQMPEEPEKPEKPKEEDCTDEDTGEIDQEWFDNEMEQYELDLKDYEEACTDYAKEIIEFEEKLKNGDYQHCLVLSGTEIKKGYISFDDADNEKESDISSEDKEISKLKAKLEREQELKVEKSIKDIKDQVFKGNVDFTKDAVKLEQDILFYYLLSELSDEHEKLFFGQRWAADKVKFDFVVSMTPEQRTVIIRDFILSKLKQYAFNSTSVASQLFLEFSKYHFEKETADLEQVHQAVFLKRKSRIEQKLKELGVNILDDTAEKEETPEEELQEHEQE
ncbi:MAG: ParB/RepB/Spo0J family partition protein [Anaerotignum sp.]